MPKLSSHPLRVGMALVIALGAFATASAQTPVFQGLGQMPGTMSGGGTYVDAVSGDGTTIVGHTWISGTATRPFRWTAAGGFEDLGHLGGGDCSNNRAYAVSFDGTVVIGTSCKSDGMVRAFRWTSAGGMEEIVLGQELSQTADAISANGSIVAGKNIRWTDPGQTDIIPYLGGNNVTMAQGVSADGQVVVGYSETSPNRFAHAFRWTLAGGIQDLGVTSGTESLAWGVSADGNVVYGEARDAGQFWRAFRWTASLGMRDMGTLGGPMSTSHGASADGAIIVGKSLINSQSSSLRAFRWTAATGMRDLRQDLVNAGVSGLQTWTLAVAADISDDGNVVVGWGYPGSLTPAQPFIIRYASAGGGSLVHTCTAQNIPGYPYSGTLCGGAYTDGCTPGAIYQCTGGARFTTNNCTLSTSCAVGCLTGNDSTPITFNVTNPQASDACYNGAAPFTLSPGSLAGGDDVTLSGTLDQPHLSNAIVNFNGLGSVVARPCDVPQVLSSNADSLSITLPTAVVASTTQVPLWTLISYTDVSSQRVRNLVSVPTTLTLEPGGSVVVPSLVEFTLTDPVGVPISTIPGGANSFTYGTLAGPAPFGGLQVAVTTSPAGAFTTDASFTINAACTTNSTAGLLKATTAATSDIAATVTATNGTGAPISLNVTVTPPPLKIQSVTLDPTSVTAGATSTATVTLNRAVNGNDPTATVSIRVSEGLLSGTKLATFPGCTGSPACIGPATVAVGASSTSVTLSTLTVGSQDQVTVSASAAWSTDSASKNLTINPGCALQTCAQLSFNCGTASDGCGGTLNCGTCTAPQTCGGGGVANVCGGGGAPGFNSPTANAPDSGGDGNGFESSPANAQGDDAASAADNNSGTGTGTSCTSSGKDRHRFYSYGFSIPTGSTINGIEVRLDARADSTSSSPKMCVQLSWDGGASWTAAKSTATLGTSMASFTLGSPTDTWGRTWSAGNFADASFRVRVIGVSSSTSRDFFLDWVAVRPHVTLPGPATLSAVSLSPTSVTGGSPSTGTVTLTAAAPSGGAAVSLSSSNTAAATAPAIVTVAAGATSATFTITTAQVVANTNVTISGTYGGTTRSTVLTVTPPPPAASLSALTLSPTSVTGGSSSTGTVTLTSAAPTGGAVVSLASSNTAAATVPASVTVAAGANSAPFTVSTQPVGSTTPVTISGTYAGVTRSATLTVNPQASDTVAIQRAEYDDRDEELRVEATSTTASATLTVYVTSTNQLIGTLTNNGGGQFSRTFSWPTNPQNITVRSSLGGSATRTVSTGR